jgi:uncharacterized membrane protein
VKDEEGKPILDVANAVNTHVMNFDIGVASDALWHTFVALTHSLTHLPRLARLHYMT